MQLTKEQKESLCKKIYLILHEIYQDNRYLFEGNPDKISQQFFDDATCGFLRNSYSLTELIAYGEKILRKQAKVCKEPENGYYIEQKCAELNSLKKIYIEIGEDLKQGKQSDKEHGIGGVLRQICGTLDNISKRLFLIEQTQQKIVDRLDRLEANNQHQESNTNTSPVYRPTTFS